jgi:hypothetical protein
MKFFQIAIGDAKTSPGGFFSRSCYRNVHCNWGFRNRLGTGDNGVVLRLTSYPIMFLYLAFIGIIDLNYFYFFVRKKGDPLVMHTFPSVIVDPQHHLRL